MFKKVKVLFDTLKYLKPIQIRYRVYYFIKKRIHKEKLNKRIITDKKVYPLSFASFIGSITTLKSKNEFCFLNQCYRFNDDIDWNFSEKGKLWTYNLNYFDFLLQQDVDLKIGHKLILDYCNWINEISDGMDPYPISLRGINWIKFLSINRISDSKINNCLFSQYLYLYKNQEYHLLGNHLLENGFSLLFGAYYFQDEKLYHKAKKILLKELDKQILDDGAHFELSTMYHQIILHRLLDSVNLIQNNNWKDHELLDFLKSKSALMTGWIKAVSWSEGTIPLLNDAANGIAPSTNQIMDYAIALGINPISVALKQSGYRKIKCKDFELILDIGRIGPDYQPGHSHADTFNFVLFAEGKPIVVDTGTSTYETGTRRMYERSTSAHNTLEIDGLNQSEIWASHRVGKRAGVKIISDNESEITAVHDGYKNRGILHQRSFKRVNDSRTDIEDTLISDNTNYTAISRIHFHPEVNFSINNESVAINNAITIRFENATTILITGYFYAPEFNKLVESKCIEVKFHSTLKTIIEF